MYHQPLFESTYLPYFANELAGVVVSINAGILKTNFVV